jgi:Cu2+-exporting ATPase
VVRCTEIAEGDELVIAPGDLLPVDAVLLADGARISLDWVDGESAPRSIAAFASVPAGAFNAGANAIVVRASTSFGASPLVRLLRATRPRGADLARSTPWWRRLTRAYVACVLAAAAVAFVAWSIAAGVPRALEVTTAVLVVTCPCAFGIATPLAYELVQSGLRRAGLFVRSPGFLDRATAVRRVVFDKTGTLTTGALSRADEAALATLSQEETFVLYNLVVRSAHPRSAAIRDALDRREAPARFDPSLDVTEEVGKGLVVVFGAHAFRLDARGYSVDGVIRARLDVDEQLRPDARHEVELLRDSGLEIFILSGDEQLRVNDLADRLGVPRSHAIGSADPEQKAEIVASLDRGDLLMIGDGINDGLAVERATCSGTPAVDRPFMPSRSDFYFTTPGLAPVGLALRASHELARVVRRTKLHSKALAEVHFYLGTVGILLYVISMWVSGVISIAAVGAIVAVVASSTHPYRALELERRDVYLREGCYTCHSQMIRSLRFETMRYGEPSRPEDSVWDHPFQWGSKRIGPDLARVGGKYPNVWHARHLVDPRATSPGSNMPPYPGFTTGRVDLARTTDKLHAMKTIGVPYSDAEIAAASTDARTQGEGIAKDLHLAGVDVAPDSELVAVTAYLQRLGAAPPPPAAPSVAHNP